MLFKPAMLAGALLLASVNAQAALTSYTNQGVDLVYSSVSNVTWTKDANLLGSLFASNGFETTVNAIIAASPTITDTPNYLNPTGSYNLRSNDFGLSGMGNSRNGRATWWGALGFINYLNSINYGGSHEWRLPTVADEFEGYNPLVNGTASGDELPELFYNELGGTAESVIPDTTTFDNEQAAPYWSGTESATYPSSAWHFFTNDGSQYEGNKKVRYYLWAVSSGQIAAVPEPESFAMLLAGLGMLGFATRRKQT